MRRTGRTFWIAISLTLSAGLALGACGDGKKPVAGGGATEPAGGAPAKAPEGGGAPAGGAGAVAPAATDAEEDALIAKYEKWFNLPMVKYEWDRNAGDPSVPAELGGPGFTGEGWQTCLEFPTTAWPDAPKGGEMRQVLYDWPATLRLHGENWNSSFNYNVATLCMENLVGLHPVTQQFIPSLATHWKISEDRKTFTYRINPEAKWSDGKPLTADDVVATWKLKMDPKCRFPSTILVYGKFEEPVAKSKYVVEVRCKEDNWRNFLYFGGMSIMPAHEISIPGDQYLEKFQNAFHTMSGPYTVKLEDIQMGKSLTITRRNDWWGEKNPANKGGANIDRYVFEIVTDPSLAFEKVKKGEIDFFPVPRAQWWVEEVPKLDVVKRGLLVMRKVYNDAPLGMSGLAINMKKSPLDDVRIRKALQMLSNRRSMIKNLFFNEYEPHCHYEGGGVWANPDNKVVEYDPVGAVELLEEAGWKDVNQELYRVKDGKVLKFEVIYSSPLSERFLTVYQEDCKKAGIQLELKRLTPASAWKQVTQKEFELADMGWGGLSIPNPETSWKSELADQTGNNNITGFKNARLDALLKEYDLAYDPKKRIDIIREIDGIVYREFPYVQAWFNPSQRFVYWNKFGAPPWGGGKISDADELAYGLWVDPVKEKQLEEARKDPSKTMPVEEEKNRFWQAWNAWQRRKEKAGK
jgi:microcin C transport system substrate-binding protein